MYVPAWFQIKDEALVLEIIQQNSFALLVTAGDKGLEATHLPILVRTSKPLVLIGHVASQNPQSDVIKAGGDGLLVFSGPHAYVSPRLYATKPNVPTWNYVAVHVTGNFRPIEGMDLIAATLDQMVETYDPGLDAIQPESTDRAFYRSKIAGLVAFEFIATKVEAKAKLSQNRPDRDKDAVVAAFGSSSHPEELEVARMMNLLAQDE